ncbi:HAD family hydrolase [Streptococcus minor]|uniref:HAD family hydrolase n=1 Tax=Streptococcus minor TaxID=229549 RepID=A0A3P1VFS7_9STRE|nr:HAD family hydrolase [Streptococcus minor]
MRYFIKSNSCGSCFLYIEPSRSIYIGDRVDNDMVPAKKLGMKTIRMKQGLGQYSPEDRFYPSDWQVASIQELLEIV